ncbi:hypothetical protein BV22DRAFT_1018812 [Leucogyrophana mollusca]|uniref:Uncharacterized protein n=1 Tax=Leucogyrophana mollusca TaxID=85980 RepID=A0ACB8B9Z6_9AGAM|nr:hypothetical protein BV22DRAFT_1018812 [Leucogyrophana mollusca]
MDGQDQQVASILRAIRAVAQRLASTQPPHEIYTSILTGSGWVQELLMDRPDRIRCALGVHKEVFLVLIEILSGAGYQDSEDVPLVEQLAIFLYGSVTGLPTRLMCERFQHPNDIITK